MEGINSAGNELKARREPPRHGGAWAKRKAQPRACGSRVKPSVKEKKKLFCSVKRDERRPEKPVTGPRSSEQVEQQGWSLSTVSSLKMGKKDKGRTRKPKGRTLTWPGATTSCCFSSNTDFSSVYHSQRQLSWPNLGSAGSAVSQHLPRSGLPLGGV